MTRQRAALMSRVSRRVASEGQLTLPAVPELVDDYTQRCLQLFAALGRSFSAEEAAGLRAALASQLDAAFEVSHRSSIVVRYRAEMGQLLSYWVSPLVWSLEALYAQWLTNREPPLFGNTADARVCDLSAEQAEPAACPVLDIGAGTGRNALALARRGHPVDALELNASFAAQLQDAARQAGLRMRVINADLFAARAQLGREYGLILASEVTSDFRSVAELRGLLELACDGLRPGGLLVLNLFLSQPDYQPDPAAEQFAQQVYSGFFSRADLEVACAGLPLERVSDELVLDYEKARLPADSWPPTPWYLDWVQGRDVFDTDGAGPIALHWLVWRRSA
ncbi:MAG: hypothetical protein RIR00_2612 [Pseudomonadota bacterium]|jgi:SAM-dependent methyltransferase